MRALGFRVRVRVSAPSGLARPLPWRTGLAHCETFVSPPCLAFDSSCSCSFIIVCAWRRLHFLLRFVVFGGPLWLFGLGRFGYDDQSCSCPCLPSQGSTQGGGLIPSLGHAPDVIAFSVRAKHHSLLACHAQSHANRHRPGRRHKRTYRACVLLDWWKTNQGQHGCARRHEKRRRV